MGLPKTFQHLLPPLWGRREAPAGRGDADDPFLALQREVNHAFANFWRTAEAGPFGLAFGTTDPRTDVVDTGPALEISLELPGLEEHDIDLALTGNLLTVKAEKQQQHDRQGSDWHLAERHYGRVQRSLTLPAGVDAERAEARFHNGVLTILVPKAPPATTEVRKIPVQKAP